MDEKVQQIIKEKLEQLSLEELKKLTLKQIQSIGESKELFFSLMEDIISSTLKDKTKIEVLDLLGEISKKALDSSASAFAREIQKGTETGEESGGEEE